MTGATEKLDTLRRVELAEGVQIRMSMAGPIIRSAAWMLDALIRIAIYIGIVIVGSLMAVVVGETLGQAVLLLAIFFMEWLYYVAFEVGRRGATPGKRVLGLRVVSTTGAPLTVRQSLIRNLMRAVDLMPYIFFAGSGIPIPTYGLGLVACAFTRNFQRLGDLAANTVVIYDAEDRSPAPPTVPFQVEALPPSVPLDREEQVAIASYMERVGTWSDERKVELAAHLAPVTGAAGTEGVHRVLGMAKWVHQDER